MKPLWKVINICAHSRTYSTKYTDTYTFTCTHIHSHIHNKLICLCLCSAPNVKVMQSQTSVGKRPSRLSSGSQVSMQSSECQSGWKFKQTRVNGAKVERNSRHARVNGESNHDPHVGSHVCSECQSVEKTSAGKRQE